jgi:hypothetical protein
MGVPVGANNRADDTQAVTWLLQRVPSTGVLWTSALLLAHDNAQSQLGKTPLFDRCTVWPMARFTSRVFNVQHGQAVTKKSRRFRQNIPADGCEFGLCGYWPISCSCALFSSLSQSSLQITSVSLGLDQHRWFRTRWFGSLPESISFQWVRNQLEFGADQETEVIWRSLDQGSHRALSEMRSCSFFSCLRVHGGYAITPTKLQACRCNIPSCRSLFV